LSTFLISSHSPGVTTLLCTIDENEVDRCVRNKTLLKCAKKSYKLYQSVETFHTFPYFLGHPVNLMNILTISVNAGIKLTQLYSFIKFIFYQVYYIAIYCTVITLFYEVLILHYTYLHCSVSVMLSV